MSTRRDAAHFGLTLIHAVSLVACGATTHNRTFVDGPRDDEGAPGIEVPSADPTVHGFAADLVSPAAVVPETTALCMVASERCPDPDPGLCLCNESEEVVERIDPGDPDLGEFDWVYRYEYDTEGRVVISSMLFQGYQTETISRHFYDGDGRAAAIVTAHIDGLIEYTMFVHDDRGRLIEIRSFDSRGAESVTEYEHDE